MQLMTRKTPALVALLGIVLLSQLSVTVEASPDLPGQAPGARIVGVWDVTVDVFHCTTGALLTTFPAMHKFELGGTGQVVPAGVAAQPDVMVWNYLGDDRWKAVYKFYRYDGAGKAIGTTVRTNQVWLSRDGTEYGGTGVSELYDLDGNLLLVQGCPEFAGTRFEGAP